MRGSDREGSTDSSLHSEFRVCIVGPVYPYRAGIAYCTTRLAEELRRTHVVDIVSFKRQYPRHFYPGGDDIDATLGDKTPLGAQFVLDVMNPLTWLRTARHLSSQKYDAVVFVWWVWVWALPYLVLISAVRATSRVILQCHNVGDKEPAWWKRALTNRVLRRANVLVVHAITEAEEAARRAPDVPVVRTFLPVHELGGAMPSREEARRTLGIAERDVALFFGHIRPFKGLDVALRAWAEIHSVALLVVAGEPWWNAKEEYRELARQVGLRVIGSESGASLPESSSRDPSPLRREEKVPKADEGSSRRKMPRAVLFDFRFIPDAEIATWFAAADVVLAPYRIEAQSGVALTAFHFRRPVIATTVGGLPEIIEEGRTGFLVPPDDPAALAAAVDRFFALADRGAMEEAASQAARRYSWEEYATLISGLVQGR